MRHSPLFRCALPAALLSAVAYSHAQPPAASPANGADVNGASADGKTALTPAALTNRTEMTKYPLDAGAKPGAADKDGNTALKLAKTQGAEEVGALPEATPAKR